MKCGETCILIMNIDGLVASDVDSVIFTLVGAETLTKTSPDDVTIENDRCLVKLHQEDTIALCGEKSRNCTFEGQINYSNKSVAKTTSGTFAITHSLATEIIDGNTPDNDQFNELTITYESNVLIASIDGSSVDLSEYAKTSEVESDIATAKAEIEADITAKGYAATSEVETKISDLETTIEGKGYVTDDDVTAKGYATTSEVESKVSALETAIEGKGYATTSAVESSISETKTSLESEFNEELEDIKNLLKLKRVSYGTTLKYTCYWNGSYLFKGYGTRIKNVHPRFIKTKTNIEADGTVTLAICDSSNNVLVSNTKTVSGGSIVELNFIFDDYECDDDDLIIRISSSQKIKGYIGGDSAKNDVVTADNMNSYGNYYSSDGSTWAMITNTSQKASMSYWFDLYLLEESTDNMNYLYVANDFSSNDYGFDTFAFNTIYDANESISDNCKTNPYTIIVMNGEYTDLQEKYKDTRSTDIQGVCTKDYVYYESECILTPSKCIITWDGVYNMDSSDMTNANTFSKCPFHVRNNFDGNALFGHIGMHTHIKGFTFNCKNTRYALHLEANGYGFGTDVVIENCIMIFGGRPDVTDTQSAGPYICGCGLGTGEKIKFLNCTFKDDGNGNSSGAWYCHDYTSPTAEIYSEYDVANTEISLIGCKFDDRAISCNTSKADNGNINYVELVGCIDIASVVDNVGSGLTSNYIIDSSRSKIG